MPRNSRQIGLGADPLEEPIPAEQTLHSRLIPTSPAEQQASSGPHAWLQARRLRTAINRPQGLRVNLTRRGSVPQITWIVALVLLGLAVLSIRERVTKR